MGKMNSREYGGDRDREFRQSEDGSRKRSSRDADDADNFKITTKSYGIIQRLS